ncbi:MAG: hypothetical protein RL596_753 [Bacteroidota bacterium]|jgi:urease accessory protein
MINKDNSIQTKISISCVREGEKTLLKNSAFDIPYKVVHYGAKSLTKHLEIMMMCYSPGVMDGDDLSVEVSCKAGAEMKLFTQSFNKLHPMKSGAKQTFIAHIEKGALFQFLPCPTIPFKDSIFKAENTIHVAESGHLIWGDIISGGRIHSGESFLFTKFHNITKVFLAEKILLVDNQLLVPKNQPLDNIVFFEKFTHQATLIIVSSYAVALKAELDEILVAKVTDMQYGFTQCNKNTIMLRALGFSGDALHQWLEKIGDLCFSFIQFKIQEEATVSETAVVKSKQKPKPKQQKPKLRA